ncbi:Oligo-1,6-glucosidase [Purpureocillium takamizusanense]|uniref:Oligo-1,6-glucosidase n=1 Tax=Purpureocillium takamizusanense TaxID=2060973 RepID=A0A9Q8QQ91_9HYPO|nr:Oligo-1,6-glucosidase [Purpureocillium takamizusanense]UNI23890.1 Oligo-1,6-glucosidase [Purpureocillium takamizusanense]
MQRTHTMAEPGSGDGDPWWKDAVVYQIYPASFRDSNGDGLGDIAGITSRLDHIRDLGATAIWLSPIFASPQKDMGYDVSDYRDIHGPYGTLADAERLIDECHARGLRVLLDLVVNHTSDQHAWFRDSRASRSSPRRDWYFWRDARTGPDGERRPPNNWASIFGGSAWTWDEGSQQYYLSLFLPSQPDLNWANEEMREAAYADMEFWFDRGADGFRIDSMNLMSKHPDLPDAAVTDPDAEFQSGAAWFASGPRMHEYLREMRARVLDKYAANGRGGVMTVGELGFTKDEASVASYVAAARRELNMVFTGDIVDMDFGEAHKYAGGSPFRLETLRGITSLWQGAMPRCDGWNAVYMDNHDSGRSLSRYASDDPRFRARAAKMLATYLTTLSGTLFLLQGQEIGMANAPASWGADDYIDVEASNYYQSVLAQRRRERHRGGGGGVGGVGGVGGKGSGRDDDDDDDDGSVDDVDMSDVLAQMRLKARDNGRLPMQWTSERHGGFTDAERPWMRVNDDYPEWNVAAQDGRPDSVLAYWREALALRKRERDVFVHGRYDMLPVGRSGDDIFAYTMTSRRCRDGEKDGGGARKVALVLLNFSDGERAFSGQEGEFLGWNKILGCKDTRGPLAGEGVTLKPYEGIVYGNWVP